MAVAICFGAFSLPEILTKADAALDFKCGENATWYLNAETRTLTISGEGPTFSYDQSGMYLPLQYAPFNDSESKIYKVIIREGITEIGTNLFSDLFHCTSVSLPSTLKNLYSLPPNVSEITITENNSLCNFSPYTSATAWLRNQPDGPVYLGNCLVKYKGTVPAGETVTIREGTVQICSAAFSNQANLTDIVFPNSLESVGTTAFSGTAWLNAQPQGALYIGKTLCGYIGEIKSTDKIFKIKAGTTIVNPCVFYKTSIQSVYFPKSVETIGFQAFYNSALQSIEFEEGSALKYIGDYAFESCPLTASDIYLPSNLEHIGNFAFSGIEGIRLHIAEKVKFIGRMYSGDDYFSNLQKDTWIDCKATFYDVSSENRYFSSDENGFLFNKDKTILIHAANIITEKYIVPNSVKEIAPGAFRYMSGIRSIKLPDGLKKIGDGAFGYWATDSSYPHYSLDFGYSEPEEIGSEYSYEIFKGCDCLVSITVSSEIFAFPTDSFPGICSNYSMFIMRDSSMQWFCESYGKNHGIYYEFIDDRVDLEGITAVISAAKGIDRSLYTTDSLFALDNAVSQVDYSIENLTQEQVDEWTAAIASALSSLEYLPADFAAVGEALARARGVDRSLYTADSLLALDSLVLSVDYNANITRQAEINSLAADINSAVDALIYREADYSAVNIAVSRAIAVKRNHYTDQSLENLDTALQNVVYGLDITQQSRVNAFADSIELAIDALIAKAADYSDVEAAIQRANSINRSFYTDDSLSALDEAISAVDYSLTYDSQQTVAAYAAAINNAIDSLIYLPADYSAVDGAIARANAIDRIMWSDSSLTALDQSVSAVNRSLNITQQPTVDAYATNILNKLNSLEYANVVLRNEPNGVIVSATSREIHPTTSLSVDKLDPSNIASANFAVGGKVKTALYYDISLYRNSVKIQPDGTVTVKIRIPDGVAPEKCKVYHVTDDPVDPLVKFTSSLDGNYIVFETDHFSEFAVLEVETVPVGIVITSPPSKTVYTKGEAFDPNGMEITAFYSNGASDAVTDYDISVDMNTAGAKTLTVYYTFNGVTKSVSTVITVEDKPSPSEPEDPLGKDIILKAPSDTRVEYGAKVTVTVSAENLPEGCYTVIMMDGKAVARGREQVSYNAGSLRSTASFTAKIIDPSGKTAENSAGKPLISYFTVEVNGGFFARIIGFFKSIFGLLPETELKG